MSAVQVRKSVPEWLCEAQLLVSQPAVEAVLVKVYSLPAQAQSKQLLVVV